MRRARLLPAAALAALLLLAGCAAEAPDDAEPPASSGTAALAVDDAPDADQTNGLVPAGYPEGFDCEGIGPLISTFTDGLYLNSNHGETDRERVCSWSDVPLDTILPESGTTEFDVIVHVDFDLDSTPESLIYYCNHESSVAAPAAMQIFDGEAECGGGTFHGDGRSDRVWAQVPFFEFRISITCDLSVNCEPERLDEFTDEQGFEALRALADSLTSQLTWVEPVIVSTATSGPDYIQDWADAGFPSHSTEPAWYCDIYPVGNGQGYDWLQQDSMRDGWDANVSDELNTERALPEVMVEFAGPGDGEVTSYAISLVGNGTTKFCIADVQEASY